MLTVAGVGDIVIAWVPPRFGTLEWEFGTIASSFAGLPLVAMGFGALLAGALGQGRRWMIAAVAWWLVASGVVLAAVYVIFLLDVPVALRAVTGEVPLLGIKRAVAKTTLLGLVFATGFTCAGVAALLHLKRGTHGSGH